MHLDTKYTFQKTAVCTGRILVLTEDAKLVSHHHILKITVLKRSRIILFR